MKTVHRTKKPWRIFAVAALAALLPTGAAQAAGDHSAGRHSLTPLRVAANANPATFTDAAGDSGTAPDITSVVVSNDANKRITFRINVSKLVVPSNGIVAIAIDSDQNRNTGPQGIDYVFLGDLSNNSFGVGQWDGSKFVDAQAPSASASTDPSGQTFSINSTDVGNTTGFNFWARTLQGDTVAAGNHDDAPDAGTWNYQLGAASPLELTAQLFHASKAKAGKPFVAVITVDRSDGTVADVTPDDVTCAATVAGRPLRNGLTVAVGPAVGCSWQLPKRSKGKTLRASITVNLDGATVTKRLTVRIK